MFLENAYKFFADDFAFLLGIDDPRETAEESLSGVDIDEVDTESVGEVVPDLVGLTLTEQAVVHEDAGELIADRSMDKRSDRAGIDSAGHAADDTRPPDLGPDSLDGLFDEGLRSPRLSASTDIYDEMPQKFLSERGVRDF